MPNLILVRIRRFVFGWTVIVDLKTLLVLSFDASSVTSCVPMVVKTTVGFSSVDTAGFPPSKVHSYFVALIDLLLKLIVTGD